jgi:drug/metabolite transporter (DMT)-like permease
MNLGATPPRVWLLSAFVVVANVVGNFALSWGMKHPSGSDWTGIPAVDSLLHPAVLFGILMLAVWTASRITLLSWADLSFVLPVTSAGYVLNAVVGHYAYGEAISLARWAGTAFILSGAVLTGLTPAKSEPRP